MGRLKDLFDLDVRDSMFPKILTAIAFIPSESFITAIL